MTLAARPDHGPLLGSLPATPLAKILIRCVPQLDFDGGRPPRYLYLSRRANRLNPAGIECLYFSEDDETADLEYKNSWLGTVAQHQPKLTFHARVSISGMLDLENAAVRMPLGLTEADLLAPWRLSTHETPLQRLGRAIALQHRIAAVRYRSVVARAAGATGGNVAIFYGALHAPDRVEVLGRKGEVLEVLP